MNATKSNVKRKLQLCVKLLLLAFAIGLYFVVLLRESFDAWETEKPKSTFVNRNQRSVHRIPFKHSLHRNVSPSATPKYRRQMPVTSTLNPMYEYSEEMNVAAENDFQHRRSHLEQSCDRLHLFHQYQPNAHEFIVSPGHGVAWCNVFKAASSIWMYYFNLLGGYDPKYLQRTKASPLELVRKRFPRPSSDELNDILANSLSFLIVREPFERLLSAYRNKLENRRNVYFRSIGDKIVKMNRKDGKKKPVGPTFEEFLLYIIDNYKRGRKLDEHWAPIYSFCTPCSVNYTIIAKIETLKRDSEYIIRQAGLETLLLNKIPPKKMHLIGNKSDQITSALIEKYFSKIDSNVMTELLNIYKPDFDLFEYNSTKYLEMIRTESKSHELFHASTTHASH